MNTANPQLEGLYLAIAAVNKLLVDKGLVTRGELAQALQRAEQQALGNSQAASVSDSHLKAVAFPIRLLQLANEPSHPDEQMSFEGLAREVGLRT